MGHAEQPMIDGPAEAEIFEAHKVDALVDRGAVTAEQASSASAAELEAMVDKLFEPEYWMNVRTLAVEKKKPGHKAEDALIDILRSNKAFTITHAEPSKDQLEATDVEIMLKGETEPIRVQITGNLDGAAIEAKKKQLARVNAELKRARPEARSVILVPLRSITEVLHAAESGNIRERRNVAYDFTRQLLTTMGRTGDYCDMVERLARRLAS